MLDSYCQQQHAVAQAVFEAEMNEIVNGMACGLFAHDVLQSLGTVAKVRVGTDSSAASESPRGLEEVVFDSWKPKICGYRRW